MPSKIQPPIPMQIPSLGPSASHRPNQIPIPSSKQAPHPATTIEPAARLDNEAAEIEREYDVNPSWSSQIFGWLAKHWKSNDANAEQNPKNPDTKPPKTGMGSYV